MKSVRLVKAARGNRWGVRDTALIPRHTGKLATPGIFNFGPHALRHGCAQRLADAQQRVRIGGACLTIMGSSDHERRKKVNGTAVLHLRAQAYNQLDE